MTDVISNILDMMRVKGAAYIGKTMNLPWNMVVNEHQSMARFHLVLTGSTWIELPGTDICEQLNAGDFIIIPNGSAHVLRDSLESAHATCHSIPDSDKGPDFRDMDITLNGTSLMCGYFQISETTPPAITSRLPRILIHRNQPGGMNEQVKWVVKLMELELSMVSATGQPALNRLTEILCLYTIHQWLKRELLPNGSLSTLADPRLHQVLSRIHEDPTADWTVESLAQIFGQSRTAFSVYFRSATGMSPINSVVNWRTRIARQL
jgi:hypothetical protein